MRAYMLGIAAIALSVVVLAADQEPGGGSAQPPPPPRDVSGVWLGGPAPVLEPTAPMTARGEALYAAAKPIWGARARIGCRIRRSARHMRSARVSPKRPPRNPRHGIRAGAGQGRAAAAVPAGVSRDLDRRAIAADRRGRNQPAVTRSRSGTDTRSAVGPMISHSSFRPPVASGTSWGSEYGHPHGLGARIEERYRRVDRDTLELVVTIDDPEMYEKPVRRPQGAAHARDGTRRATLRPVRGPALPGDHGEAGDRTAVD